jgi:hypothetical protein
MSASKIQYIIIRAEETTDIISGNYNFENYILDHLRYYPEDLLQFKANFNYLDYTKKHEHYGMQVLFFTARNFTNQNSIERLGTVLSKTNRICVFFFAYDFMSSIGPFLNIVNMVIKQPIYYSIYTFRQLVNINGDPRYFMDQHAFYNLFKRDTKKLSKHITKYQDDYKSINLKVPNASFDVVNFFHFKPIVNNVINIYKSKGNIFIQHHYNWKDAPIEDRHVLMLESLQKLDQAHAKWGERYKLSARRYLPTLILIFPFHNPLFRKVLANGKNKIFEKIFLAEQDENFLFKISADDEDNEDELRETSDLVLKTQLEILDGIGYLHSTFQFSPVLRFPIRSSEINAILSIFSLSKKTGIAKSKSRYKSIIKLGRKLSELYLSDLLEQYISQRDGQILIVSDLPIEWMSINGVPLSFLCDVCRLQDSNIQGVINTYSAFSKISFQLGSKSVKRSLVIFSGSETDRAFFNESYRMVKAYQQQDGFSIAFASNGAEIKTLLEHNRPEILIFDCHCLVDAETLACYLQIGDDRISPESIVQYSIVAPIIYLACCNSNPNYDSVNKLHDAFFQNGALSVTGTFLPIDMMKGTFMYLRMLRLLNSENERRVSGNWLHFVSFAIRTSLIWEARHKCYETLGRELTELEEKVFIELLERLHRFEDRSKVFYELQTIGLSLSSEVKLILHDTNLEFVYYNHYGRPDLITFRD